MTKRKMLTDEQVNYRPKAKKRGLTSYDEEDECKCRKKCSKRSCICLKFNKACSSSCGCKSSCENIFNKLDYFFGENSQCSAHPCFANWISKNIKKVEDLQTIDRNALRKKIIKCPRFII